MVVELSDFTIDIMSAKAITGRTLSGAMDKIETRTPMEYLYQARDILKSPTAKRIENSVHNECPTTNNVAEYEVVIVRIRFTKALGTTNIKVHINSRLMANKISGNFISK